MAIALAGSTVATSGVQAAPAATDAPKSGGSITVAIDGPVGGHCFSTALAGGGLGTSRAIYEQLFERTRSGKFVGFLAESATTADNVVWNIKLRPGIKYSNGEAFDAKNVKQNMDIGRGILTSSAQSGYLSTGVAVNANIVSVDVVDDLNVKVTLDRADTAFPALLYRAGRYVMRAPAQIADTSTCQTNPIGTGPFMKKSYVPEELVVVRNPNYWRKDGKGRQLPYLDQVAFISVKEASQRGANGCQTLVRLVRRLSSRIAALQLHILLTGTHTTRFASRALVLSPAQWLENQTRCTPQRVRLSSILQKRNRISRLVTPTLVLLVR